ncbi:MAG TPA: DUF4202 family protein [Thermoanaerobaculia bacterium]
MLEQLTVLYPREAWNEGARGTLSARLAAEFPSIFVGFDTERDAPPLLRASEWGRDDFDAWQFDVALDEMAREPFTLLIADDNGRRPEFPLEVLNRCQRHVGRRNRHSQGQLFTRVLQRHRKLHDLAKPLVRADYNHALDVWQWMLRLEPNASVAVQFAALFHDVERLSSESDARVEHLAADYQSFKDAHAAKGGEMTREELGAAGVDPKTAERVAQIVAAHERQGDDPEVALLNDADALSFFSLNSHGYANYFSPEQTRKKVAYTLNRMRPAARSKMSSIALRPDIREMVERAMVEEVSK